MPLTFEYNNAHKKIIMDEAGIEYTVGNLIFAISDGPKIYTIEGQKDIVYVEAADIEKNKLVIRRMSDVMSEKSQVFVKSINNRLLWPDKLVKEKKDNENVKDNGFKGFISRNPQIQGDLTTLAEVIEERKAKTVLTQEERQYYLNLGIQLAEILETIHECGYVVGVLTPDKLWLSQDGTLISCITYRFSFQKNDVFDNPYYVAPEWFSYIDKDNILYEPKSDSFLYAIILFQLLTGKYPFLTERNISEVKKEELWEQMVDGKSLYFWEDERTISEIKKELETAPKGIDDLFESTFDYCGYGAYDEPRASVLDWLLALKGNND